MQDFARISPRDLRRRDRIERYFTARYPAASSRLQGALRKGEVERRVALARWLPDLSGLSVLDAGCGDGASLASVARGRPSLVALEDLVLRQAEMAASRWRGRADRVEARGVDVTDPGPSDRYDVVVALGVLDYAASWTDAIAALLGRTAGLLVCDVPRSGRWHHALRRLWLASQGLGLTTVRAAAVERVRVELAERGLTIDVDGAPLAWILGIRRGTSKAYSQ